jgi:hypothetical protein
MKWEYTFIDSTEGLDHLIEKLNVLGADGWEAVSCSEDDEGYTVLLKRPVPLTSQEHIDQQFDSAKRQFGV